EASSNGNKRTLRYFSSFYMCYLLACIFICPVLLYYDTFRNVFLYMLIVSRFTESFILYPLMNIASYCHTSNKSFIVGPIVLLVAVCNFIAYAVYESIIVANKTEIPVISSVLNSSTSLHPSLASDNS
ncbi:hypothetical protein ENBRE01_3498, partial [Enteropsectra breve]